KRLRALRRVFGSASRRWMDARTSAGSATEGPDDEVVVIAERLLVEGEEHEAHQPECGGEPRRRARALAQAVSDRHGGEHERNPGGPAPAGRPVDRRR